jgi:hypothetical protein
VSTLIAHDPYARGGLRRFTVANPTRHRTCGWCGQAPARLYAYAWERDDSHRAADEPGRTFCNLDCYRTYRA